MKQFAVFALFLTFIFCGACPKESIAQENPQDHLSKLVWEMFQMHQGKTLCSVGATSLQTIRANVVNHLKAKGSTGSVTAEAIATALWTLYPCPFSPFRPELRPVTSKEIEGVWIFPETSQKFRFGPQSGQQPPTAPLPVKCDAVGYYPGGELRHAIIAGQTKCPFEKAADLDVARKNPRVSNWSLLHDGRISVTRTDVSNHIEEWDAYVVVNPFTVYDVQFVAGDLVAYLRRENGNEVGASTQFRHLQRLP